MIVKIRIPRLFSRVPQQGMVALAAGPLATGSSFHAALTDTSDDWVVQRAERAATFVTRSDTRHAKEASPNGLARAWSWLHAKYAATTTKRLRVSETVSLGEKRFVALVCVEGREFLVGGGASGVSLLAQLGSGDRPRTNPGCEGDTE